MVGEVHPDGLESRVRAFYFQGLPVQAYRKSALVQGLEQHLDLVRTPYHPALERPAREHLDLAPRFDEAAAGIADRQRAGAINLIGYSVGGYAAMAVAARLVGMGRRVGFVALIDSSSYYPEKAALSFRKRLSASGYKHLPSVLMEHGLATLLRNGQFETAQRVTLIAARCRGRLAAGDLVSMTLSAFWRESVRKCPPSRYGGEVSLFAAEHGRPRITDPLLGWEPYAGQIRKVMLKGSHWTLTEAPNASANVRIILETLRPPAAVPPASPSSGPGRCAEESA